MGNRVADLMTTYDDTVTDIETFYRDRAAAALEMVSPTMDGRGTELTTMDEFAKAALASSDTGAVNAVYDYAVITNYATKKNTVGAIPKKPWMRQGWRGLKTAAKTSGLGVAEGAVLGTSVKGTYFEIAPTPKEVEIVSEYTQRLKLLTKISDGVASDQMRRDIEADFWRSLENDIHADYNTLAVNNVEGLPRICSSTAELTALSYTAGDEDLYGVDRSTETWFSGNPLYGSSGTNRDLQVALINDMMEAVLPYWTNLSNKWYVTGPDTWMRWSELEGAKIRLGMESYSMTIGDGVQVGPGIQMGGKIATWDGIPVVVSDAVDKTGDTISPIMLLDNDHLAFNMGLPISYYESGDMFAVGHLIKGVWYGILELVDDLPRSTAKLRDLQ